MAEFEVVGNVDPFLLIRLRMGEKIHCESNAMVTMEANLELKGEMQGGLLSALTRRFASGESLFQQSIEAVGGAGETLLAPSLPGDIMLLDVGAKQFRLNDGAFLAADSSVEIKVRRQSIGQALFGGSGGFFVMETSGSGKLAISGFGALFCLDVKPGADVIVDNAHAIAWDAGLRYELSLATANSGLVGRVLNSMKSGEGLVQRFSGEGKVVICSRSQGGFLAWLSAKTTQR